MILINGWYFNFSNMMAYKGPADAKWPQEGRSLLIRGNGTIGKRYKHELVKFFDPPEDHFNNIIDEAYIAFQFEEHILK